MSWHYSQAVVVASLGVSSMDGAALVPWSVKGIHVGFLARDKTTDISILSRFGRTFARSRRAITRAAGISVRCGVSGQSLSSAAGFPAKTSALPERVPASPEKEAGCGKSLRASLAKFDRATCSWRTHQFSLAGGLELFLETWPRWGMMRGGECWELPTPSGVLAIRARITSAIGSGFLRLPTPRTADGDRIGSAVKNSWKRCLSANLLRGYVLRFPTPMKQDGRHALRNWEARMQSNQFSLPDVVGMLKSERAQRFPTPMARDWKAATLDQGGRNFPNLETIVMELEAQRFATPAKMSGQSLRQQVGGVLNPEFHAWLMGWPIGWTDLAPLVTDKFLQWCSLHGKS